MTREEFNQKITEWLSKPEHRQELEHHTDGCDSNVVIKGYGGRPDENEIDYTARLFGFRKGCTVQELEKHIWDMWCDGSKWLEEDREALGNDWDTYLSTTEYIGEWKKGLPRNQQERRQTPYFPVDMIGEYNQELVEYYFNHQEEGERCIHRTFSPDNQLADNYRLEVITTPDDTQVVGWTVVVD